MPRSPKPSQVTPDVTPEKAKNQRKRSNDQGDSSDVPKKRLLFASDSSQEDGSDRRIGEGCWELYQEGGISVPTETSTRHFQELPSSQDTQAKPMDLTQGSDVSLGEVGAEGPPTVNIIDTDSGKNIQFDDSGTLTLGRKNVESGDSDHIRCVSREHCQVSKEGTIVTLKVRNPYNPCYVWRRGKWKKIMRKTRLYHNQIFRLLPRHKDYEKLSKSKGLQYQVRIFGDSQIANSFDQEYKRLLQAIDAEGKWQKNKKGDNLTFPDTFKMTLNMGSTTNCSGGGDDDGNDNEEKDILPITSLRNMYEGRAAIIEALWYLRGEDNIKFLQKHRCPFWDAQALDDGFVGLNYGLLTNYPRKEGGTINQLEEEVIKKLCKGESRSRNMVCNLFKPDEFTVQGACSSQIQFCVVGDKLDLTVCQRSSDVILGLPHDAIVWSIIYHLVRREVLLRTERKRELRPGKICFNIASAHVYKINETHFDELLERDPIISAGGKPQLHVEDNDKKESIFEIAQNYPSTKLSVKNYTSFHPGFKIKQAI